MVKPWLAKETVEKVDICGKDYREVLLHIVDADNLPTTLGGNCTCSGTGGCDLSSAGPWMDERLAKRAAAKEDTHSIGSSDTSTPITTPSECVSSIGTYVEVGGEPVNLIHEKVVHGDSMAEAVTATQPEVP